jgi:hypothetical protein
VIALLNRIPVSDGGAGGSLNGRIVAGLSSDALYRAITRLEDKHFPGQRSGFADPGGLMLQRMEELAARTASVPPPAPPEAAKEDSLDVLRRNVLDESQVKGVWTAGELVAFEPLVTLAVRHIDSLKEQGFKKLSWDVEMFGRAHVVGYLVMQLDRDGTITYSLGYGVDQKSPLPEMRYGSPVIGYSPHNQVVTAWLGALLLYADGTCVRVRPWHRFRIMFKELPPLPIPADGIGRYGKVQV